MAIAILAAAGAAAAKAAATVGQVAATAGKVGAEAASVAGKVGGQAAATTAQSLVPKTVQSGCTDVLSKGVMDLKTGKILPDEILETDVSQRVTELIDRYCDELEQLSPCKDTLNVGSIRNETFRRLSPEETMSKRLEFDKMKPDLIRDWESVNNRSWPRYENDIYSEAGNLIRPKGGLFDAHHAHPLGMGGENKSSNITPMSAVDHYDKQGIHASGGAYDQLFKLLEA